MKNKLDNEIAATQYKQKNTKQKKTITWDEFKTTKEHKEAYDKARDKALEYAKKKGADENSNAYKKAFTEYFNIYLEKAEKEYVIKN